MLDLVHGALPRRLVPAVTMDLRSENKEGRFPNRPVFVRRFVNRRSLVSNPRVIAERAIFPRDAQPGPWCIASAPCPGGNDGSSFRNKGGRFPNRPVFV